MNIFRIRVYAAWEQYFDVHHSSSVKTLNWAGGIELDYFAPCATIMFEELPRGIAPEQYIILR